MPFYESVAVKPLQPALTEARPGTPRTPRFAAMDSSLEDICSRAVHRVVDEESLHRSAELLYAASLDLRLAAVEEIRRSAKDNADARLYIGQAGLIPALIGFLGAAIRAEDSNAIETACFALLNVAILYNLSCMEEARKDMAETNGGISALAEILYSGSQKEKELVVGIFLALAINDYDHSQIVLSEGVIPSLVMVSIHGSTRGKEKAQKLLQHFREERQNDSTSQVLPSLSASSNGGDREGKLERGFLRRKTLFFRKSKSFSFYHC